LSRLVVNIVYRIIFCFVFCLVSLDGQFTYVLGTQASAQWDAGSPGNNPTISYSADPKKVQVELVCQEGSPGDVQAVGEGPDNYYKFRLTGKCACWNGCKGELF
jgi:hypothetical protein